MKGLCLFDPTTCPRPPPHADTLLFVLDFLTFYVVVITTGARGCCPTHISCYTGDLYGSFSDVEWLNWWMKMDLWCESTGVTSAIYYVLYLLLQVC